METYTFASVSQQFVRKQKQRGKTLISKVLEQRVCYCSAIPMTFSSDTFFLVMGQAAVTKNFLRCILGRELSLRVTSFSPYTFYYTSTNFSNLGFESQTWKYIWICYLSTFSLYKRLRIIPGSRQSLHTCVLSPAILFFEYQICHTSPTLSLCT